MAQFNLELGVLLFSICVFSTSFPSIIWKPKGWWNISRTETRTSPINRDVIDRELLQLSARSKNVDEPIRQDQKMSEKLQAAWIGAPCRQGDDGDFGVTESLFPLGSPFAYGYRGTENGWELLSHPPFSPDLAPSDYRFFGPLKDHLRGHHYETDEAVQEPCVAGCEELKRNSTAKASLRFCKAGRNT
jgi:hypothetical protein